MARGCLARGYLILVNYEAMVLDHAGVDLNIQLPGDSNIDSLEAWVQTMVQAASDGSQ